MDKKYEENAKIFKALSDTNRIIIIDILSSGEKCACELLEFFNFTQPTLSHHMKVLMECGLVNTRKEGIWNRYSLNCENTQNLIEFISDITRDSRKCICKNDKCADGNKDITD